jgi:hypothetical protein
MGYQYVRAVVMVKQLRYEINAYRHWSCEFESRVLNNISFISWRSVLLEEETEVQGENHRPV